MPAMRFNLAADSACCARIRASTSARRIRLVPASYEAKQSEWRTMTTEECARTARYVCIPATVAARPRSARPLTAGPRLQLRVNPHETTPTKLVEPRHTHPLPAPAPGPGYPAQRAGLAHTGRTDRGAQRAACRRHVSCGTASETGTN
jgi:hypothetical protein